MVRNLDIKRILSLWIIFAFWANTMVPIQSAYAQEFTLPAPGVMVHLSPEFNPPILKGIKVHPDNPFQFDFILDKGDSHLDNDQLKDESTKLIKYFLASLTIPEKDLWVNLSPYEKDRIIPQSFGLTEMGRDLLAEDYMLKQITASLIYPEDETGKKFWKCIYEEAQRRFGTTNIPVNTFNKVWIIPEKAVVYENAKAGTAYVIQSKLKVMLEQDYLSLEKHEGIQSVSKTKDTSQLGSQIVREIVIPKLTKEVNEDKNFSQLRQVYNSLILAVWYKKKIKDSILSQVYTDKNKVTGVNINDPQEKDKIYQQYLKAFKKGAFNYIKEDVDYVTQGRIPRKYFSGGVGYEHISSVIVATKDAAMLGNLAQKTKMFLMRVVLATAKASDYVELGQGVYVTGLGLLSSNQVINIQQNLSLCRPEDLIGLNITVIPSWHPMVLIPLILGTKGFQYGKGIVLIASLSEGSFSRLFRHELTHWLLRNKPYLETSLAQGIFNANGSPNEGVNLPGYYSGINIREYSAELAVYAASHKNNDNVITARQREIILTKVFHANMERFYIPQTGGMVTDRSFPYLASTLLQSGLLMYLSNSSYFKGMTGYGTLIIMNFLTSIMFVPKSKHMDAGGLKTVRLLKSSLKMRFASIFLLLSAFHMGFDVGNVLLPSSAPEKNIAIHFAKGTTVTKLYFKGPGSDQQRKEEGFIIQDQRFLGPVPLLDPINDKSGLLNTIAMIYRYYGVTRSDEDIVKTWGDADIPASDNNLPGVMDGMSRDTFTMHILKGDKLDGIINAMKNGHPVIFKEKHGEDRPFIIIGVNKERWHSRDEFTFTFAVPSYPGMQPGASHILGSHVYYADDNKDIFAIEMVPNRPDKSMLGLRRQLRVEGISFMAQRNGGIDLTPSNINLKIQNSGGEIKFHLDPAMLQQVQNAAGFLPVIINIQPMINLRQFLFQS